MKNGKSQLILLDHGLYKQIDDEFRVNYANLWKGLLIADITEIKAACSRIGIDDMVRFFSYFETDVSSWLLFKTQMFGLGLVSSTQCNVNVKTV